MCAAKSEPSHSREVLIVGGGFTGLFAALHFSRLHSSGSVTLIDWNDRFVFKPLLYELLTGEMHEDQVCPLYDELLKGSSATFLQDSVSGIDLSRQTVHLASGKLLSYRYLVLALGSVSGFFGIKGAEDNSFPFRTYQDALALARHLRSCLEQAVQASEGETCASLTTFTVVGAGPAGVEMAGTLGDLLPIWYGEMGGDPKSLRIVLMNRSGQILKGDINERLREDATQALQTRTVPVELLLGASVSSVEPGSIRFEKDGQTRSLATDTVIWTAGSSTHPLLHQLDVPEHQRDHHGRLKVKENLVLPGYPNVFAGGDCAAEPTPLPPTAQVAYQQGRAIAHGLVRLLHGQPAGALPVHIRGSMLKLGIRESAVNLFGRFELTGTTGHLIRQATYLELLPTPVHDLRATAEWLRDETFHRFAKPTDSRSTGAVPLVWKWAGAFLLLLLVAGGSFLLWQRMGPHQQRRTQQSAGLEGAARSGLSEFSNLSAGHRLPGSGSSPG